MLRASGARGVEILRTQLTQWKERSMLYLRNPMFNVLTTEEADALHARMLSAYHRAGDLFASNKYDAIRMRSDMSELVRDLEIAGWV